MKTLCVGVFAKNWYACALLRIPYLKKASTIYLHNYPFWYIRKKLRKDIYIFCGGYAGKVFVRP